jgi:hypothetical protein
MNTLIHLHYVIAGMCLLHKQLTDMPCPCFKSVNLVIYSSFSVVVFILSDYSFHVKPAIIYLSVGSSILHLSVNCKIGKIILLIWKQHSQYEDMSVTCKRLNETEGARRL